MWAQYTDQAFPALAGQGRSAAFSPAPPVVQQQQHVNGYSFDEPRPPPASAQAPRAVAPDQAPIPKPSGERAGHSYGGSASGGLSREGGDPHSRADSTHPNGAGRRPWTLNPEP